MRHRTMLACISKIAERKLTMFCLFCWAALTWNSNYIFWPIVHCLFFYFILFYLGYRFSLHNFGIIYISSECLCVVVCSKHSLSCQSGVDSTENARLLSWIYNFHNWNEHLWAWWFSIVFAELTAFFGNKYKNQPYFLSRNYWNRSILYT